jgi:RHS repeat-associated protein
VTVAARPTFLHNGFGAGPVVFSDAAGELLEERRFEPFGAPIDARVRSGAGEVLGAPDLAARDLNALNKRSEAATGWSDHGARWMAPETGRWLSTDPPVAGPDAGYMFAPWTLHPYQYANQNPALYWDPTGNDGLPIPANQPPFQWAPLPKPPVAPPPAAPAAGGATAGEAAVGLSRAAATGIGVGVAILLWPRDAGKGSTCDGPDACGKGDERRRKNTVNLDTGAIVNATQLSDPAAAARINAYLAGKRKIITRTAYNEFMGGPFKFAGASEKTAAATFLMGSVVIPDAPSDRVMNLTHDSKRSEKIFSTPNGLNDKVIFGTGDTYRWTTATTDKAFIDAAAYRGVVLSVEHFQGASYAGR